MRAAGLIVTSQVYIIIVCLSVLYVCPPYRTGTAQITSVVAKVVVIKMAITDHDCLVARLGLVKTAMFVTVSTEARRAAHQHVGNTNSVPPPII